MISKKEAKKKTDDSVEGSEAEKKGPRLQAVKGMHDTLPLEQPIWEKIRKVTRDVSGFYHFQRIDTPVVEKAEVFEIAAGATSEVVEKQMYVFRSGRDRLALRPEATAGIARAYIQHGLGHQMGHPVKLYFEGEIFRHEQPQAGRYRAFHQVDFEIISTENDPVYDAQVITASYRIIEDLKIKNSVVQINSVGCRQCRPLYIKKLKSYYKDKTRKLCVDCRRRLTANPLRVLDCKNETCSELKKDAPNILDSMCAVCKKHFKEMLELVEEVKVPYVLNPHLVRGLDYYTKTVFEIFTEGYEGALAAGGRYDGLIGLLGGRETPAVGVALGVERLIEVIKAREIRLAQRQRPTVFLIHIGVTAKQKGLGLIEDFRKESVDVIESLGKDSLKAQLKAADKAQSSIALILGQKEAYEDTIILRDMKTGAQETVPIVKIISVIKKRFKS
jgi:histidyl-tRNA synthetase